MAEYNFSKDLTFITSEFKEHYTKKFEEFGDSPRGVDWNKEKDLLIRYEKMLAIKPIDKNNISILDVGCGYGGLYSFACKKQFSLKYTGIDVVKEMISYAKRKYPKVEFHCIDVFKYNPKRKFDYVICNGILTQKLSASIIKMDEFAKQLIKKMFDLCEVGIAFNIMTTKVNYMEENLYYKSPIEILAYCLSEITNKIKIDHSYQLYEYTVYLYKE